MPPGTESAAATATAANVTYTRAAGQAHALGLRGDIQWLRGLSVLAVLLYHADKALLPGGYLGVDVFFVLSGFLITRNIFPEIERGTFSYPAFIARRFRRLLPACYAMLIFAAVLGSLLLTRADLFDFLKQLAGTLSFSANIVLWRHTGYFDTSSALKPLLHTWSLSLEEQYYLALPLLLSLAPRRRSIAMLITAFLASLLACVALLPIKPSATFFLLPFRAWELLAGSICAVISLKHRLPGAPGLLKFAALATIVLTLAFPPSSPHPGLGALLVVFAASVLMINAIDFGDSLPARAMIFLGDISYSLYLFHWPLFAVANHVYADTVPMTVKGTLMCTAVALSYLSYRFVEQPFRKSSPVSRRKVFSWAAGAGALVMLLSLAPYLVRGAVPGGDSADNAPNYGLGQSCAADSRFVARPECQSSAAPSVLLWGDSYAMHLADALSQQQRFGFIQATKSHCGPVPGVAPVMGVYNEAWARKCLSFNDSVLSYLEAHPEIRAVILGSKWRQYFNDEGQEGFLAAASGAAPALVKSLDRQVEASIHALVARLTASGRKVLIVQPPPSADFNIHQCAQRRLEGLPYIGPSATCRIGQAAAAARDAGLSALLRTLAPVAGVTSYSFAGLLCDGEHCRTELDNVLLYRDEGHLSRQGSRVIGEQSTLNATVSDLLAAKTPRPPAYANSITQPDIASWKK